MQDEYIVSKQRVADHGEVYTRQWEVNAMLAVSSIYGIFDLNYLCLFASKTDDQCGDVRQGGER